MKNIDSDLIRGNIDTIILKTLLDGDKYGLDIIKEVDERSNGTYELKQPTLYSCLKRLENQELISSYWLDSEIGGRRHYYKLTEKGHEFFSKKQEEWAKSKFIIDNLLSNYDYDEYRLVKKDDYDKIIEGKQADFEKQVFDENNAELNDEIAEDEQNFDEEETSITSPSESQKAEINSDDDIVSETPETNQDYETTSETEEAEEPDYYKESEDDNHSQNTLNNQDIRDESADDNENKKYGGYKFSSVYDSINIDGYDTTPSENNENSQVQNYDNEDEELEENNLTDDDDFAREINEYTSLLNFDEAEDDEDNNQMSLDDELQIDNSEEKTDEDVENSPTYVSQNEVSDTSEEDNSPTYETRDQTQNELNILSRLRMQDDDEINEYVGDKHSYINHLNQEEKAIQQNLLLESDLSNNDTVDDKINDFASTIKELNNFNSASKTVENDFNKLEDEIQEPQPQQPAQNQYAYENAEQSSVFEDNFLKELEELKSENSNGYFDSIDTANYDEIEKNKNSLDLPSFAETSDNCECDKSNLDNFEFDASHAEESYNSYDEEFNETDTYNTEFISKDIPSFDESDDETQYSSQINSLDEIISKNVSDYSADNENLQNNDYQTNTLFTPTYTARNYKQKLSNLSNYSKVSTEETPQEDNTVSDETLAKVKDINALKTEFEDEGIKVKEYKKYGANEQAEKNYLLINKLNLVKSLILLFGYVFILSAVYVIMHSTDAKNMLNFSFIYFVYGMIPFAIYAIYYTVIYLINPYKKITAKYAPRILIFIAIIITVQLLLITYCVNLQLGFYSFSQQLYNHLLWVVPMIVSFAPIFVVAIHTALFYSKNFNV